MYKTFIITAGILAIPFLSPSEKKMTKAPDFSLESIDGKTIRLSEYQGKIVVLEWFNYNCSFTKYNYEQTTVVKDLIKKYKDQDVVFLAINSTDNQTLEKNKEFAERNNVDVPILQDVAGTVARQYQAKKTPEFFIIDRNGNIVYRGALDNAPMGKSPKIEKRVNYVDKALNELIKGERVSKEKTKPYGCPLKLAK